MIGFFLQPTSPINLAVVRITVFSLLAIELLSERQEILRFAHFPRELLFPPYALGWTGAYLWIFPLTVEIAWLVLLVASIMAALGLFTRAAAIAAVPLAVYVFGIAHFSGAVTHYQHHLTWFAAILAVSPCADAWSVDATRTARRRGLERAPIPPPAPEYGVPIRLIWVLFGLVYLFPGIRKLEEGGLLWDPTNHIYKKWVDLGQWLPAIRVDQFPPLVRVGGVLTLAFEIGFLPLVLLRVTRPFAVAAGLVFHAATFGIMQITFWTLPACYPVFIDWARLLRRREGVVSKSPVITRYRRTYLPAFVGGALIGVVSAAGFLGVHATWPIDTYPPFARDPGTTVESLGVEVVTSSGKVRPFELLPFFTTWTSQSRYSGLVLQLLSSSDDEVEPRFRALWKVVELGAPAEQIVAVRFYRDTLHTPPDRWPENPASRKLIHELNLHST